jgi:hypothetical protein
MASGDGDDTLVFHKTMVADWQSGVLDADIGSDSWSNWEAIQGSAGADRIRTNRWYLSVENHLVAVGTPLTTGDAAFIYHSTTGLLSFSADGNGGGAPTQIARPMGPKTLVASDIQVRAARGLLALLPHHEVQEVGSGPRYFTSSFSYCPRRG